jgi:hypothetical protein
MVDFAFTTSAKLSCKDTTFCFWVKTDNVFDWEFAFAFDFAFDFDFDFDRAVVCLSVHASEPVFESEMAIISSFDFVINPATTARSTMDGDGDDDEEEEEDDEDDEHNEAEIDANLRSPDTILECEYVLIFLVGMRVMFIEKSYSQNMFVFVLLLRAVCHGVRVGLEQGK